MVTAIVLLNAERNRINDVAQELVGIDGISEVYSVSGDYDLIAMIRVRTNEELADLVTDRMLQVDGVTRSHTMLAFRTFSRHDLDSMFSIGAEPETG